jgi:hypothetical protein
VNFVAGLVDTMIAKKAEDCEYSLRGRQGDNGQAVTRSDGGVVAFAKAMASRTL